MRVDIQPGISVGYLHRATGIRFDERFWNDAEYRAVCNKKLTEASMAVTPPDFRRAPSCAGDLTSDAGNRPFLIGVGQQFLIVAGMFDARILYYDGSHPNADRRPLENWTLDQIARLEPPDVARSWPLSEYMAQYDALVVRYGAERVELPSFVERLKVPYHRESRSEFLVGACHAPFTLAYRLRGEKFFLDMVDDLDTTWHLLDVIVETMINSINFMAAEVGKQIEMVYQPCCMSALVSPRVFEMWDLPSMLKVFRHYGAKNRIHSCGPSTHLLSGMARIPDLVELELGEGTDMARARELWPEASLIYIPDSPKLPWRSVEEIKADIRKVIEEASSGPLTIQHIYEVGLSLEKFHAVYDVVREHNAKGR